MTENMRISLWVAVLLTPLIGFLLVPASMLAFSALKGSPGLSKALFVYWLYVIPVGYTFVLTVLLPARYLMHGLGLFSLRRFTVLGCLLAAVLVVAFDISRVGTSAHVFWVVFGTSATALFGYLTELRPVGHEAESHRPASRVRPWYFYS